MNPKGKDSEFVQNFTVQLRSWRSPATATLAALLALSLLLPLCGCDDKPGGPTPAPKQGNLPVGDSFEDATEESGLQFLHTNGRTGEFYFTEIAGSGCALFDYDGDGDLDAYLVQSQIPPGKSAKDLLDPPPPLPLHDRLFRNDLVPGGALKFVDVTAEAGLTGTTEYGMGVTVGDIDNDGDLDLYVSNFGPNQLFRNNGDGTFSDITEMSNTNDTRWSSSCAFVDINKDGWLDLFVCTYVNFNLQNHKTCYGATSAQDYCGPLSYERSPDLLFLNKKDGTFEDITTTSNIASDCGGALGVVCADFDGDGQVDIYVANDALPNQLWINQGNRTFTNEALLYGVAMNEKGAAEASMGVTAGDPDGDGDMDIFLTHLSDETNTLYENDGKGYFTDSTVRRKLGVASHEYTGFGTGFFDFDNDGWLDIFCANGAVKTLLARQRAGDSYPLDQKNQLFRNTGDGDFVEVTAQAGAVLQLEEVTRGAAFGDIDNDGDTDILISNNLGPARLLRNRSGNANSWIGLEMFRAPKLIAVGARVEVLRPGKPSRWYRLEIAGGYCSANDARLLIGLGDVRTPQDVRVHWGDGSSERFSQLTPGQYHKLSRGEGSQ